MVQHLNEHINGFKIDEPFYCKLCGIRLTEKDTINKHMISQVESVLKESMNSKALFDQVVEKLTIFTESENEAESETELDTDEDLESFMKEFDPDGNRIITK